VFGVGDGIFSLGSGLVYGLQSLGEGVVGAADGRNRSKSRARSESEEMRNKSKTRELVRKGANSLKEKF
jgi:hypothetical protein